MEPVDRAVLDEAAQAGFFAAMLAATRTAQTRQPDLVSVIVLAGIRIRLRFSGPALHDMLIAPISHLLDVSDRTDADATFNIWDSASTGTDVPAPPCPRSHFTDRGDIWGMESPRYLSAFHWLECSIAVMDCTTREAIHWVDDPEALPYWSRASPLRTLLHWTMTCFDRQLLHAAVVGTPTGGVLLTGKGGIGKSTTALRCLEAGMTFLGDDYVVVANDPVPRAYSLYSTAKLDDAQAAAMPSLLTHAQPKIGPRGHAEAEKTVLQLHPACAASFTDGLDLRAILVPAVRDQAETTLAPADPEAVLRAAAFTTLAHLPRAGRLSEESIARLCRALPHFELRLGRDPAGVPAAIRSLLAGPVMPAIPATAPPPIPRISVIIPVFNGTRFLPGAIRSILAQDCGALDIIVIDDGSTEDVAAAVGALPVDVRLFRQENAGPAAARNRGIREASGDLLAFLDVDDEWPAGNLRFLAAVLAGEPAPSVAIGYGQLMRAGAPGGADVFVGNPLETFPWSIAAALFRRAAFAQVGLFDETLRFGEDADWFKRAGELGVPVERVQGVTLHVRRHETNMTRGKSMVELNALRVLKKALDRGRGQG